MQNWFKFYGGEYLIDPKIDKLSPTARSCWITLLCYASVSDIPGEIKYLDEDQLMIKSGVDPMRDEWNETVGILDKLATIGMIKRSDNGMITVLNYRKRQDIALTNYERVKKYRVLKRNETLDNEVIQNDNTRIEEKKIDKNRKEPLINKGNSNPTPIVETLREKWGKK